MREESLRLALIGRVEVGSDVRSGRFTFNLKPEQTDEESRSAAEYFYVNVRTECVLNKIYKGNANCGFIWTTAGHQTNFKMIPHH